MACYSSFGVLRYTALLDMKASTDSMGDLEIYNFKVMVEVRMSVGPRQRYLKC